MAKGDYESMIGGTSPELSNYIYKKMKGLPVTAKEIRDAGDEPTPLPRPRPKRPQTVNRAKKGDALMPIVKKANGGMIDRAAVRGKTKGKMC